MGIDIKARFLRIQAHYRLVLTLQDMLAIHDLVTKKIGGQEEIRDYGLLLSVLYRPQTGYYNDSAQMSAALIESVIINHPFVDGNKRVAFFGADVFWPIRNRNSRFSLKRCMGPLFEYH